MVAIFVALTDRTWFERLRRQGDLTEVNFWQPGGEKNFRALQPGELFLFKLHSPENFIVGGGVFAHSSILPISLAWDAFGQGNGADSLDEMRSRVGLYRRENVPSNQDFKIGCRILTSPFWFEEPLWVRVPASFSRFVQQGKRYSTDEQDGRRIWEQIEERIALTSARGLAETQARYGEPTLIRARLGQGSFRIAVTDAYYRRCAITGEKTLPVLEAAHIKPFAKGGEHRVSNGLLLRSDLHKLFDVGYMTVTPKYVVEVSDRIREDFDNGRYYYGMHGKSVAVPRGTELRPSLSDLNWHNSEIFLG
jgi:putative restriction endonuclease